MPEGDTVFLAAKRLREALEGRTLTRSDFRVPRYATVDLTGRVVAEVVSRGKHLLIRVEPDVTVHTHFRMDGIWRTFRAGQPWRGGPGWQIRIVLGNAEHEAVGYRIPVIDVVPRAAEEGLVGHLGPDLLGPDWDGDEAVRRLAAQPDREIGAALLDQRNLAGIGNLYKTELCFLRGVSPWTPIRDAGDLSAWVDLAHRLLTANIGGYAQSTTGDTNPARRNWVYGRRTCLRCGGLVQQGEQGAFPWERVSAWCPHCQPGPFPDAPPSPDPEPEPRRRFIT
ncbi:MAG TPA: DNA-formamidopyrimidine glycosylase family protein [Jiangellaceae bacterium]|jgi:endonuclease-8|nr:DNA-formamidopyrimidine glycosylase family protein [Jiangellaceae bacterium]